jgi:putative glutamine amidotransferase
VARPVIGICSATERARWSVWDQEALITPRGYVDAVQRAGGQAILLPPDERAQTEPDAWLDIIDGLILAGGTDIDPSCYGADRHTETTHTTPRRDRFELALARRAIERELPLLGICRGMQLMNVACGGTLLQHLPESHGHHEHRRTPGTFDGADHDVRLAEGSLAHRAAGEALHSTKSHHHQGIDRLGDGLRVSGWATLDELPEAVETAGDGYALGVQWHPEADETSQIVASLVREAAEAAAGRAGPGARLASGRDAGARQAAARA